MDMKTSVYIVTTLDGFIARRDGSIDWLNEANDVVPMGEDCGFMAFMDSYLGSETDSSSASALRDPRWRIFPGNKEVDPITGKLFPSGQGPPKTISRSVSTGT